MVKGTEELTGTIVSPIQTDTPPTAKAATALAPKVSGAKGAKASKHKAKPKRKKPERSYPQRTLQEALAIPERIKEVNNGNPWRTEEVAKSCGYTHTRTGSFFYLSQAARDYGLTIGSYNTEKIELSELGRNIMYAPNPQADRQSKIDAFFKVETFQKVFEYYGGSKKIPQQPFLGNVLLNEFHIHSNLHEEFLKLFRANCQFLGIEEGLTEAKGNNGRVHKPADFAEVRADIRVVGQPKGEFERTAFVIMPFSEKGTNPRPLGYFDEVLNNLITPAGNHAGFAVETAQRHGSEVIQSTIINQLLEADLVICDLTDHNPNVLFELGIRITKGLPIALIKTEGTGPIFDVDHLLRVLSYSPNMWPSTVSRDVPKLKDHFSATWENRMKNRSYIQILTEKHPVIASTA